MRVVRAHDGVCFEFDPVHFSSVDGLVALQEIVGPVIGVEAPNLILMNSLGSELSDSSLSYILGSLQSSNVSQPSTPLSSPKRSLATPSVQVLYAFDRQYVSADPFEALEALAVDPQDVVEPRLPPFDPKVPHLEVASSLALVHQKCGASHLRTTLSLLSHVRAQKVSLAVALNNLDKFLESRRGALEAFETFAQPLVREYGRLLDAFGPALALAKIVKVHPHLLPASRTPTRSNSTSTHISSSTGAMRTIFLGDYVMEDRIVLVRDRCAKVYEEYRTRFDSIRARCREVTEGATKLRQELEGPGYDLQDLIELERDADEGYHRIEEVVAQLTQLSEFEHDFFVQLFSELSVLDEDSRDRVSFLVERKSFWLHHIVGTLNKISSFQGIIPNIGAEVQALDSDLKTRKDSFKHLARLKDFVAAYSSTVVEVVRRREYAQHLADYASALASSLSRLSNEECKRRAIYQAEYVGKMPFSVEGLEDTQVPTIELQLGGYGASVGVKTADAIRTSQLCNPELPPLTRADVNDLITFLRSVEQGGKETGNDDDLIKKPAREARLLVEKCYNRLEAMEDAFVQALENFMSDHAPRSIGTASEPEESESLRIQVNELMAEKQKLLEQIAHEQAASLKVARKAQLEAENHAHKCEDMKLQLLGVKEEVRLEREALVRHRQDMSAERDNISLSLEKQQARVTELEEGIQLRSKALQDAERQLTSARATAEDATRELHDLEARHRDHLSDHHLVANQLEQSRFQCKALSEDLSASRKTCEKLASELESKQKLHENHLSEAEQVRLKMEKQISELQDGLASERLRNEAGDAKLVELENTIKTMTLDAENQTDALHAAESKFKADSAEVVTRLETHCLAAVRAVDQFRAASCAIRHKIDRMPKPGSSQKAVGTSAEPLAQLDNPNKPPAKEDSPAAASRGGVEVPAPSSPEFGLFLENLLKADPVSLVEVVEKKLDNLSQNVRKWMKEAKGYGDRAKRAQEQAQVKISFRDFAKGDLALFLPTRNPTAQVWAAFNVSFPHYFLQANEAVAPIISSREWLVARIVSLVEKLVDPKEPDTNPYSLPPGTRYFLLEVEPWSVEKSPRKSHHSISGMARFKKQSMAKSTNLPGPESPQADLLHIKRRNLSEPLSPRADALGPSAAAESTPKTLGGGIDVPSKPPSEPSPVAASSSKATRASAATDLNHSEFTVIDPPGSPAPLEAASESPFRTTLDSSTTPSKLGVGPSGLALSLRGYHKSPLGTIHPSGCAFSPPRESVLEEKAVAPLQPPSDFEQSGSARPAFLANMSTSSSQSPRASSSSNSRPTSKPRLRPIPKAYNACRSLSRASSLASSANMRPALKALLNPGSPLSKGSSTVSTTFASAKDNASLPLVTERLENQLVDSNGLDCSPSAPQPVLASKPSDVAQRRLSFTGATTMAMLGNTHVAGSCQNSNSSLDGSALYIGQPSCAEPIGAIRPRSPSMIVSTASNLVTHPEPPTGGGSISSSLFGPWRKRKESLVVPGSFGGASDLLKRFSRDQSNW